MNFKKSIFSILLCSIVVISANAQFTKVQLQLQFLDASCRYGVYLIIEEGEATSLIHRIQSNSQITVVAPIDCGVTIGTTYNPKKSGGLPIQWTNSVTESTATHSYYSITPAIAPVGYYDADIQVGDTILLFDLVLTNAQHGPDGIRLYRNDIDINAGTGLNGDFSNGFTIGSTAPLYNGNAPQEMPDSYVTVDGPSSIYNSYSTQISTGTGGVVNNLTPSVIGIASDGTVTGLSAGEGEISYQSTSGCTSHTSVTVSDLGTPESIGIGISTPHPSAILDLSSDDKGLLIPRMSALQRLNIASPPEGLIVFQHTGNKGFYYYSNNQWRQIAHADATNQITAGASSATVLSVTDKSTLAEIMSKQSELETMLARQSEEIIRLLQTTSK